MGGGGGSVPAAVESEERLLMCDKARCQSVSLWGFEGSEGLDF